jgi:TolB-like protein
MGGEEVRFGQFRFDLGRRELLRDGLPVRLGSRALDILSLLASARGDVVTKDQLLARVWPGQVVEENNLQVQISTLRRALDEDNSGQSHLVTVPGRGYRLIGVIDSPQGSTLPDKPSIAVLPFQNMSDDPKQDYFADDMVEDIITALCHMRWLFVIARNSSFAYKGRAIDVKQVGRELGVRYVLEGGVRKAAQRVRITAQLIDTATGAHLWADHFDGALEDIFDLQDQVTASVVGAMSPLDPFKFSMQGVTAFAHFFAGRYEEASAWAEKAFWERPNILATLRIAAVSNARAGRMEEVRKAVARALELDPEMRLSNLKDRIGTFRRSEDFTRYADALRQAGLPE